VDGPKINTTHAAYANAFATCAFAVTRSGILNP